MTQHTPEPWKLSATDETLIVHVDKNGRQHEIAETLGNYKDPKAWPLMAANARLIKLAPTMVKLLRQVDAAFLFGGIDYPLAQKIQRVLQEVDQTK